MFRLLRFQASVIALHTGLHRDYHKVSDTPTNIGDEMTNAERDRLSDNEDKVEVIIKRILPLEARIIDLEYKVTLLEDELEHENTLKAEQRE